MVASVKPMKPVLHVALSNKTSLTGVGHLSHITDLSSYDMSHSHASLTCTITVSQSHAYKAMCPTESRITDLG